MNGHTPRAEHDPRPPHDPSAEGSRSRDLPPDAVTAVRGVDDDAASPPRLTDPLRHPQHAVGRGLGPLGLALGAGWAVKKLYDRNRDRRATPAV